MLPSLDCGRRQSRAYCSGSRPLTSWLKPLWQVTSVLPFAAGEPGRDLLQQPAVAIRIAERRVREVRAPFLLEARRPALVHLADVDAAADEIVAGGVDVVD